MKKYKVVLSQYELENLYIVLHETNYNRDALEISKGITDKMKPYVNNVYLPTVRGLLQVEKIK